MKIINQCIHASHLSMTHITMTHITMIHITITHLTMTQFTTTHLTFSDFKRESSGNMELLNDRTYRRRVTYLDAEFVVRVTGRQGRGMGEGEAQHANKASG